MRVWSVRAVEALIDVHGRTLCFPVLKNWRCIRELTMFSSLFRSAMTFTVFALKNSNLQAASCFIWRISATPVSPTLRRKMKYSRARVMSHLGMYSSSYHEPRIPSIRSSLGLLMRQDATLALGCSLSGL